VCARFQAGSCVCDVVLAGNVWDRLANRPVVDGASDLRKDGMAKYPDDLRYSRDHVWVRVGGHAATIGITDFAVRQLGEIVSVELATAGDQLDASDPFGTVESVKAVIEVFMPLSGAISALNEAVKEDPELVNTDPYGRGWLVQVKSPSTSELDGLMGSADYAKFIEEGAD
jgi:glycine cleavage system H protein